MADYNSGHEMPDGFCLRNKMPETVIYNPYVLTEEQRSTIVPVDLIHESLVEIANLLTDSISVTLPADMLESFENYIFTVSPTHFAIEEKVIRTFFPDLLTEHRYEHTVYANRIEGFRLKLMISPKDAQQYLTNVMLDLILEHFIVRDIEWIEKYKGELTQEERDQFLVSIEAGDF